MSDQEPGVTGESLVTIVCQPCVICGRQAEIRMPLRAAEAIRAGVHIQNAWPDSTPDERELIISGTHPDCWDKLTDFDD